MPEYSDPNLNPDDFAEIKVKTEEIASLSRQLPVLRDGVRSLAIALLSEDVPESQLKEHVLKVKDTANVSAVQLRSWCEETRQPNSPSTYLVPIPVLRTLDELILENKMKHKNAAAKRGDL